MGFADFKSVGGHFMSSVGSTPIRSRQALLKVSRNKIFIASKVDTVEEEIEILTVGKDFNDHHIVATVIVSKCRLICSDNKNYYVFFLSKGLLPRRMRTPLIYS